MRRISIVLFALLILFVVWPEGELSSSEGESSSEVVPARKASRKDPKVSLQRNLRDLDGQESNQRPEKAENQNGSLAILPGKEQKSLWEAFAEARLAVRPIPDSWSQREENQGFDFYSLHPKQNMTTRFGDEGVQIVSSDRTYTEEDAKNPMTSWKVQLRLISFAGEKISLGARAEKSPQSSGKVEYRHLPGLIEWYDNGAEGMEHGYTIERRPENSDSEVTLEVSLSGLTVEEQIRDDGKEALVFMDEEREVLSYSKLLVVDADGKKLPASMKPTDDGFILAYSDAQAAYPVTVDPLIVNEEAKLNRIDNGTNDQFGKAVAISGDTAVVGSAGDDDDGSGSGSAYVFTRNGSNWGLQSKLTAADAAAGDNFGVSVSISGDSVIVGANFDDDGGSQSGSAYVFTRSGTMWLEQAKLASSDTAAGENFGISVSISGDTVVVGASLSHGQTIANTGNAYVFTRSGSTWSEQAKLSASDASSASAYEARFGNSVSISGDTVAVGAYLDDSGGGTDSGSAYVFKRSGSTWSEQAKLEGDDAADGSDEFGSSVSISGDTVVVGVEKSDELGTDAGIAYVFTRSGSTWSQQDKLEAMDAAAFDSFGISGSISGDSVVVGAYRDDDNGNVSGSAYVFTRSGSTWTQQAKLTASDGVAGDEFGYSVAISGDTVIAGAYRDDVNGFSSAGSAYVFTRSGSTWSEQAKLSASDVGADDNFGISVSISGETVVVGAEDDNDAGSESGSAYVFIRSGSTWSLQSKLTASDASANSNLGNSVSISGDTVVVGAFDDNSGSAYVFTRSGRAWSQQAKLTGSNIGIFSDFGKSVSISGDTVVVGANLDNVGSRDSGSAYVFVRSGSTWSEQAKLSAFDGAANDEFGFSVSISGDTVVVGATLDDENGSDSGSAYVFTRSGSNWSHQEKLTAFDGAVGDWYGRRVAISGDTVVVGAFTDDDDGQNSGSVYVYTRVGNMWSHQEKLTASDAEADDWFGRRVAISGDTVVISAPGSGDDGIESDSAYIFTRSGSTWTEQAKLTPSDPAAFGAFGSSVSISGDTVVVGAGYEDINGASSSGSVYVYRFSVPSKRDLLVFDHLETEMANGGIASEFSGHLLGTSTDFTFSLGNAGVLDLDIQSVSIGGADAGQFSLVLPDISSSADLSTNESFDYTIVFSPTGGVSGLRSATVLITSNDTDTPVFSFSISGLGFSNTTDTDSDGMSDWGEYQLRGFGLDWTQSQPIRVSDYYEYSSSAGLFTESQIAGLNLSARLVAVDPVTDKASFAIGLEKSDGLQSFSKIIIDPAKITVDVDGNIRYELDASAGQKFFRAEAVK